MCVTYMRKLAHKKANALIQKMPSAVVIVDAQVREALRTVGKSSIDDELNCGGCGYDSCRQFGKALLNQMAARSICVTYMRKLAHKKANALIQKMPSAVVIVDAQVREALRTVGKSSIDDELNCGGCGYDSCRQFGKAL